MESTPAPWSLARKFAFRFAFLYWLLYSLPFPLANVPLTGWIVGPWGEVEQALTLWWGWHVLALNGEVATAPTGSGDTRFAFAQLSLDLVLALVGAVLWSVLARRRTDERRLVPWSMAYVRIVLGATLISYGSFKVIPSQFPPPSLDRLAQPFGDASPMGLLWTFMGASAPYQVFTGVGELLGGVLLFQRRTSVLGALVAIVVLAQVVALNFCFDVPVKLYSSHLLLMAVFLLLPEASNLFGLLVRGRGASALARPRLLARPRWHRGALVLRTGFLGLCLFQSLGASHASYSIYTVPPPSPFDGVWRVQELVDDPDGPLPDDLRWTELVVGGSTRLGATSAAGRYERFGMELDQVKASLKLSRRGDPAFQAEFTYEQDGPDSLRWNGTLDGHPLHLVLARRPAREYLLVERGFHWVNEVPFNR